MKQVLLYFGKHPEHESMVSNILDDLTLPYRVIHDEETMQTLGFLMKLPGFQADETTGKPFPMDLMFLNDISDEQISAFNTASKQAHCEMKQKAMLTKHNQHWRFYDLLAEIQKEHTYFEYADKIHHLLQSSQKLIIDDYTAASWKAYEQQFYKAYEALQQELSLEEIIHRYEAFLASKDALQKK